MAARRWLIGLLAVGMVVTTLVGSGSSAPAAAEAAPRRVTAWLPWWDQARALESFEANADLFGTLSPFWYEMTSATVLSPYSGAGAAAVLDAAHSAGVPVVPTITNDFDAGRVTTMLATSASRQAHVQAIVGLVVDHGYDGIDIDYENLAATDRARYSAFLAELGSSLHGAGKVLTVAVHPKTSEPGSWSGPQAQDYAAIGAAADRVRVMAYDYHWASSSAGAIAPITWVDEVATFATTVIPAAKVELGIGLYGYDWVGSAGVGLTHDRVMERLAASGATPRWSDTDKAPWFTYGSGGKTHTVWYENARSVGPKLAISDRLGLAGVALWRLGGEDPEVWSKIEARWGVRVVDTTAPTTPTNLKATAGRRAVELTWTASTDESGPVTYAVYRSDATGAPFVRIAVARATAYGDGALRRHTQYQYRVTAVDDAQNESAPSAVVSVVAR